jgi:general secretion pathway protein G
MNVNNLKTARGVRTASGFSLLEMVIVLGIIALILGAAIQFSGGIMDMGRDTAASAKMNEFTAKLEAYRVVAGMYPSQNQGLQALVEKPTSAPEPRRWRQQFKELPKDPWNEEFIYYYPGKQDSSTYEIVSKGSDMEEGTDDDISSQDPK